MMMSVLHVTMMKMMIALHRDNDGDDDEIIIALRMDEDD